MCDSANTVVADVEREACAPSLKTLPIEVWETIVEYAIMEGEGDEQCLKLADLLRLSQICRRTWRARLNTHFFKTIDMASGFRVKNQDEVLCAYESLITENTRLLKFGTTNVEHPDPIAIESVMRVLSTNGKNAERVHLLGADTDSAVLAPHLIETITSLKGLTHLHIERYTILYQDDMEKLFVSSKAVQLIVFELLNCYCARDMVIAINAFAPMDCPRLRKFDISGTDVFLDLDLEHVVQYLPQLEVLRAVDIDSMIVEPSFDDEDHVPFALRHVALSATLKVLWREPSRERLFMRCPQLESVHIGGSLEPPLNWDATAAFDNCHRLTHFSADRLIIHDWNDRSWSLTLECLQLKSMTAESVDRVLFSFALLAARHRGEIQLQKLDLARSSSSIHRLAHCLKHVTSLTVVNLKHHKSLKKRHRAVYRGREEITNLIRSLHNEYIRV